MSTGWTWEYVGQHMDLPRLFALSGYWKKYPPVHVLFAAYAGYEPKGASGGESALVDELFATGAAVKK